MSKKISRNCKEKKKIKNNFDSYTRRRLSSIFKEKTSIFGNINKPQCLKLEKQNHNHIRLFSTFSTQQSYSPGLFIHLLDKLDQNTYLSRHTHWRPSNQSHVPWHWLIFQSRSLVVQQQSHNLVKKSQSLEVALVDFSSDGRP